MKRSDSKRNEISFRYFYGSRIDKFLTAPRSAWVLEYKAMSAKRIPRENASINF